MQSTVSHTITHRDVHSHQLLLEMKAINVLHRCSYLSLANPYTCLETEGQDEQGVRSLSM